MSFTINSRGKEVWKIIEIKTAVIYYSVFYPNSLFAWLAGFYAKHFTFTPSTWEREYFKGHNTGKFGSDFYR